MGEKFLSNFKRSGVAATLILFALLMLQPALFAQQTGQITGTVVDGTGAAIVNAKIILTDEATKATRQTTSNGVGFFSFSAVMPANYDLKVDAKGFKVWTVTGIHISPGDKRDIAKVEMAPGAATAEQVTVEATVTGVDIVSSPEKSSTITAHDIERQSTVGRNALELIRLLPGMTVQSGMDNRAYYDPTVQHLSNSPTNNYGMNGMAPGSGGQSVSSDGAQILDVGNMGANLATVNMDMVQEVKVQTSNFSADTNRGPIVINAVGKAGSSAYHGSGYFYARNNVINALDWFNKSQLQASGQKPTDNSYYYPGATFGGPVKIPGTNLDKKMFFFVGMEVYRQNLPQDPILAVVPTEGMRHGDFSWASMSPLCAPQMPVGWQPFQDNPNIANVDRGPSYCYTPTLWWNLRDGSQTTPIVNGQLPSSLMNPATQAYLAKWLPQANTTPTALNSFSNFVQMYSNAENSWQLHPRVDYNFNDSNKLYLTYNLQKETSPTARAQWWAPQQAMLYPGDVQAQLTSHVASANFMHVFSPSLTSETVLAMTYYRGPIVLTKPKAVSRSAAGIDLPMIFDNGVDQLPAISGGGIPSLQMQSGFLGNKWLLNKSTATVQENVTKVFSTHTLKVGGNFERIADSGNGVGNTASSISFAQNDWQLQWAGAAGNYSGWAGCNRSAAKPTCFNPVANMLFGWVGNYSQDENAFISGLKYNTAGLFATDNWKMSKRLTLDLGVRYDYIQPWTDIHGIGAAIFDPQLYAKQVTVDPVTQVTDSHGIQYPGMKWHAMDKSVPIAGTTAEWGFISPRLGLSWDVFGTGKWVLRGGWGSYYYQGWHNAEGAALTPGQGQRRFNGSEPYGGWNLAMIADQKGTSQVFGDQSASFITPNQKQPRTDNWNFTISHPTFWGSFLEVSYVGNQTVHQQTSGKNESINLIPIGSMYNKAYYKAALSNSNTTARLGALSGWTAAQDWYRPYTWYNDQLTTNKSNGWANYHALQVSWSRSKGWATFGLNYTFSKAMGIYTDADPFNLQSEYGPLNFDRTHAFNTSYSFDLGNHVRGDFAGSKILKGVANGWQLSGITQVQSGLPYQAINSANLGFNTWVNIQNTYNYNATGDPMVPNARQQSVPMDSVNILGTPDVSVWPTIAAGCDPTAHNGDPHSVFNTMCFMAPQFMQNAKHWMGYFHSPGYFASDLTMAKSFRLAEKKNLQFKMSAFNFLNHPLWGFNSQDYSGRVNNLASMVNPSNPSTNNAFVPGQRFVPTDWYGNTLGNVNTVGTPPIKRGNRMVMLGVKFEF